MEISLQEIPYTHHAPVGAGVFLPEAIKTNAGAAFRVRQMKTILL